MQTYALQCPFKGIFFKKITIFSDYFCLKAQWLLWKWLSGQNTNLWQRFLISFSTAFLIFPKVSYVAKGKNRSEWFKTCQKNGLHWSRARRSPKTLHFLFFPNLLDFKFKMLLKKKSLHKKYIYITWFSVFFFFLGRKDFMMPEIFIFGNSLFCCLS